MHEKGKKKNWIEKQCSKIGENLRKNKSKRAYQLVKDLTTVKQGKSTTVQDRSEKCLIEEREKLNRWTEYCSELYNHKANGDPSVPQKDGGRPPHPSQRSEGCSTIIEEREDSWSLQNPSRTGPSRWRGCNHRSHDNLQQDRRMANPLDPGLGHYISQESQLAAAPELLHQPSQQSHAEDHTEAASGEDHC